MESERARSFGHPDEVIDEPVVREEVVRIAASQVGRFTVQPGWKWSTHVKPRKGTDWCEARHVGVCTGGRLGVSLANGGAYSIEEGQVFVIPPGHDIWVDGDQPAETIEWAGALAWHPGPEGLGTRVLTTLLLSDIVDSTPTAERMGSDRWKEALRTHDAITADVINRFHGTVVKHTGDGALATFASARNALSASLALGDAVRPVGLEVRIGVHTGEVEMTADDVHGLTVHELARICSAASAAEVVASGTTKLLTGDAATFSPMGSIELKGLSGEYELFGVSPRWTQIPCRDRSRPFALDW